MAPNKCVWKLSVGGRWWEKACQSTARLRLCLRSQAWLHHSTISNWWPQPDRIVSHRLGRMVVGGFVFLYWLQCVLFLKKIFILHEYFVSM